MNPRIPSSTPPTGQVNSPQGVYPYIRDLLALDACRPPRPVEADCLRRVATPLHVPAWASALDEHPDANFRQYIVNGLTYGFRIGFDRRQLLGSVRRNIPSAETHPAVVGEYLTREADAGRIIGPLEVTGLHVNRIGVIPKGHTPGKWRLITDLSFPPGRSVNDGIDPGLCSMSYITVDTVAKKLASLGPGALMAKVDVESAYRLVPVHPDDRPLLAIQWNGAIYGDAMLPFGLRSAPKIFSAVADALEWCFKNRGVSFVEHYLDDYILAGPPDSDQCAKDLRLIGEVCTELNVPLAEHKREGPTTQLTFLGIEIDTVEGSLRLPQEKLERLVTTIQNWGDRKVCSRRELESLVGSLNHACKVIRSGRTFLRRMIDLLAATGSTTAHRPHHHIRLNREFRADLAWWRLFLRPWNGVGLIECTPHPSIELASDASGSWGCGAWCGTKWFQYPWNVSVMRLDITVKELVPIVIAAAIWGSEWRGTQVTCYCDNQAVVAVMGSRSCREKHLMHLLRCLFFFEAHYQFRICCRHIPGSRNGIADDLSRNNLPTFFSKVPEADPSPARIPSPLPDLLLSTDPDWLSPNWTQSFRATLNRV